MADSEAASSSAETPDVQENEKAEEFIEPEKKKRKFSKIPDGKSDKLEQRLGGILCCAVCLDLPRAAIYQDVCLDESKLEGDQEVDLTIDNTEGTGMEMLLRQLTKGWKNVHLHAIQCTNGHLMCAGCFTHVLADARLRDEIATCPNCRVEISKTSASRNLAVEKAVNELPSECQFCGKEFPRIALERHEDMLCDERITNCKYSRIGCPWRGPFHEATEHEKVCVHPHRSGAEVMEALQVMDLKCEEEKRLYDCVFDLLSYEKITFNDLQMKPYRTDEFVHKLFYETSRFTAFNNQWVMKARINNSQRDPTQSSERNMTYQLILKTKTTYPLQLYYLILRGPFGDMRVDAKIHKFEFSDQENESPYVHLPLPDTAECNRLLAAKVINFRLIMFLSK